MSDQNSARPGPTAGAAAFVASPAVVSYVMPGAIRPAAVRRRQAAGGGAFVLFGVLVPLACVLAEVLGRWCSELLFDPLPTAGHALFALAVPLVNAAVYLRTAQERVAGRRLLGFLNAVAIGSAMYFCVTFAPAFPVGVIGIVVMGLGLLVLGPFFGLGAAVLCRARLRRWNALPYDPREPDGRPAQRVPLLLAGLAVPLLVLAGPEVRRVQTLLAMQQATSANPYRQAGGVRTLRTWGDEQVMLDACFGRGNRRGLPTGWDALAPDPGADVDRLAGAFYRATGRPPEGEPARADWRPDRRTGGPSVGWQQWEEDQLRGGEAVGRPIDGLSLVASNVTGTIHPDAATSYAEWTLEFRNDTFEAQEARCRVLLPEEGVVSRVTLWINGQEREAAYGGRAKVRQAYQSVAVVQRRDPVLVTACGADRVMLQCFPVPAGGTMKTKIGVSAPLHLAGDDAARGLVRLPCFLQRNFAVPGNGKQPVHDVWVESGQPVEPVATGGSAPAPMALRLTVATGAATGGTAAGARPAGDGGAAEKDAAGGIRYDLAGRLTDDALSARVTLAAARRPGRTVAVAADPFDPEKRSVVQTVRPIRRQPAARLAVVVDGSGPMASCWADVCDAVAAIPAGVQVFGAIAADAVIEPPAATPAALAAALRAHNPVGGQDAVPALVLAVDRLGDAGTVLWVHGAQPVELSDAKPLEERLADRPNVRIVEVSAAAGHNRVADALSRVGRVREAAWAGSPGATIRDAVAAECTGRPAWVLHRERRTDPPTGPDVVRGNINLSRLWAAGEVDRLIRTGRDADRDAATKLAVGHQLVTAVSGAVVLETQAQYDAHNLNPVAAVPLPPAVWAMLAMVPVLVLAQRRIKKRAAAHAY